MISPSAARPEEAIAWHRKRLPMASDVAKRLGDAARRRAFVVAGLTQQQMLQDVKDALARALANGTTIEDFKRDVGAMLTEAWQGSVKNPAARLHTIFRTNLQSAYNAGRFAQATQPDTLALRPFWQFDATLDGRTTDACKRANGTILPANDPWWQKNTPPLHFNCRSSFHPLTRKQAERLGVAKQAPGTRGAPGFGHFPTVQADEPGETTGEKPELRDPHGPPHEAPSALAPPGSNEKLYRTWKDRRFFLEKKKMPPHVPDLVQDLHSELTKGEQGGFRDTVRQTFASFRISDQTSPGTHPGFHNLSVWSRKQFAENKKSESTLAFWHPGTGAMVLRDDLHRKMVGFLEKCDQGRFHKIKVDEVASFRVVVHELVHSTSPIDFRKGGAYSGIGVTIEEATTEILSHHLTEELLGYGRAGHSGNPMPPGHPLRLPMAHLPGQEEMYERDSYESYVATIKGIAMQTLGADEQAVDAFLKEAALKMRSGVAGRRPKVTSGTAWAAEFATRIAEAAKVPVPKKTEVAGALLDRFLTSEILNP